MSDPIRIAIIGTGLIVTGKHWPALHRLKRDFRVVALVNRTPAKAEALAATIHAATHVRPPVYTDYQEMLAREQPDAVSLALPTLLNPEVTEACLAAGCHVIAEKPIAASLADGRRMLDWPQRYGRTLMIAENCRYMASYQHAAALIAVDTIGKPLVARWSLYASMGVDNPYYHTTWRQQPAHPGGYISDGGVHQMAVLRMLLGEPVSVVAQTAALRPDLPPLDTLSATFRFADDVLCSYAVTYACPGPETALQITGTQGALLTWGDRVELWQKDKQLKTWAKPSAENGMVSMYEDFARSVRSGQPPFSTAAAGLADLQMIVAMLAAAEAQKQLRVADVV